MHLYINALYDFAMKNEVFIIYLFESNQINYKKLFTIYKLLYR